jgi:hypothetical protein
LLRKWIRGDVRLFACGLSEVKEAHRGMKHIKPICPSRVN